MTQAFPLQWPHWVQRTPARNRQKALFRANEKPMTVATARERLQKQLDLLGVTSPVLSTNVELRLDGQPRSNQHEPDDVGVAVYFSLKGKQLCMPCDRWLTVADNITAVAQHIDATRRIERYGVQSVEEAFAGFVALPPPFQWRDILGLFCNDLETAEASFKTLAKVHHPDRGGSAVKMAELGNAIADARKEFGK